MIAILPWVIGGGWRYLAGAAVVALVVFTHVAAYNAGYESAETKCNAAALQAQLKQAQVERDTANARLARSAAVVEALQLAQTKAGDELDELRGQLRKLKLQSTAKGAKRDTTALMDDRCRLTTRGARGGVR